jgi:hypothetical protein
MGSVTANRTRSNNNATADGNSSHVIDNNVSSNTSSANNIILKKRQINPRDSAKVELEDLSNPFVDNDGMT